MRPWVRRLIGLALIVVSVYFVAVVAYAANRLASGGVEFRPWMFGVIFFGGLAYLSGRFGWRMARRKESDDEVG